MDSTTSFAIPLDLADVAVRRTLTIFLRGPFEPHKSVFEALWRDLGMGRYGLRFELHRSLAEPAWKTLKGDDFDAPFSSLLDLQRPLLGCRGIELAERSHTADNGAAMRLVELAPVFGAERASYIKFVFNESVTSQQIVGLSSWMLNHLPVWWGSAGFVFDRLSGSTYTAYRKIAALAKRYWCVQVQDVELLQRDALDGMPGIGWLTLVGEAMAQSKGLSHEFLIDVTPASARLDIFARRCRFGVILAAGSQPLRGDINEGESLAPYAQLTERLAPLLLQEQESLFGPFLTEDLAADWLRRFQAPQAWLEREIPAE